MKEKFQGERRWRLIESFSEHSPDCVGSDPFWARYGGDFLARQLKCCEAAISLRRQYEAGMQREPWGEDVLPDVTREYLIAARISFLVAESLDRLSAEERFQESGLLHPIGTP